MEQSQNDKDGINHGRRKLLGQIALGGAAAAAGGNLISREEKILAANLQTDSKDEVDGLSAASRIHTNWAKFEDLKKPIARGKILDETISRIIMGGNLVGGWAHARDLIYASDLVLAYHTRDKIFATFKMAEACGINCYLGHHSHIKILMDYWDKASGSLKYIADCSDIEGGLRCAELGASACYVQGETDRKSTRLNSSHT